MANDKISYWTICEDLQYELSKDYYDYDFSYLVQSAPTENSQVDWGPQLKRGLSGAGNDVIHSYCVSNYGGNF